MKKIITIIFAGLGCLLQGQIIISENNTGTPTNSSVLLEFGTSPKGIILPAVASAPGAVGGTFIVNTTDKAVQYNNGSNWISLTDPGELIPHSFTNAGNDVGNGVIIGAETSAKPGVLVLESDTKALVLPRITNPHLNILSPIAGTVVYDTTSDAMAVYDGAHWSYWAAKDTSVSTVTNIDCSALLAPAATAGQTGYTGSFAVSYTGGSGAYAAQTLTSSPAGFTANLAAGTFSSSGSVTYTVTSATVPAAGDYTFNIILGGKTCTKTITVSQNGGGILDPNITLAGDRKHFIASVFDVDYLPYTAPVTAASTAVVNADGTPDAITVDYQGTLTTTGITVQIPVASVSGSGSIGAWTSAITVPANLTQNNIATQVQLSWAAQPFTSTTKYITATIKAIGNDLLPKKLDINAGIGNDNANLGVLLGSLPYPTNSAGAITGYQVRDIPGIPDRMFGQADASGLVRHNFLYLPISGGDGQVWLNNNLGADYSNVNSANFNPAQQAAANIDAMAQGNFFQWGRLPDGHEFPSSTSITSPQSTGDVPGHSNFISQSDWRSTPNYSLWQGSDGINNPCPIGFNVPTQANWQAQINTWPTPITGSTANNSVLKLPASQGRSFGGSVVSNSFGIFLYWTQESASYYQAYNVQSQSGQAQTNAPSNKGNGYVVRCIQNNPAADVIPATVTLVGDRKHFIASVFDVDYLPYTAPVTAASTAVVNADGTPEAITVDYQGTLTTTGITVQIPVASVSGSGNIGAWTSTITVPANLTQNNIATQVQLSWAAQPFTPTTKYITATITAIGNDLLPKKLDINAGIGNDNANLGILLGSLPYPTNSAGAMTGYQVRDIPGIPDKEFGKADGCGVISHNFLYLPVMGNDGELWLNNNLGADYSNINKAGVFNLAQQALSATDYHAYGSLFQWGRQGDGHELINWTNSTTGSSVGDYKSGSYSTAFPGTCNIVMFSGQNWQVPVNESLWNVGVNNPCPIGFHVPTQTELAAQTSTWVPQSGGGGFASPLKFTAAGYISGNITGTKARADEAGVNGHFYTSSSIPGMSYDLSYSSGALGAGTNGITTTWRYHGESVRCIQD